MTGFPYVEPGPGEREPEEPLAGVRTVSPDVAPCLCVTRHVPATQRNHWHHIIPLSWGGPDTDENQVALCPTGHDTVHWLLWKWGRAGVPGHYGNQYLEDLARRAWASRP